MNQQQALDVKDLAKPTVEALEYISDYACDHCGACQSEDEPKRWKWEPEPGEWCIVYDKVVLIYKVSSDRITVTPDSNNLDFRLKKAIPILHWETLERVLKEVESFLIMGEEYVNSNWQYEAICRIKNKVSPLCVAESRQEAVMRSVIQLAKELR